MTKPKNPKIHYPIPPIQQSPSEPPASSASPTNDAEGTVPTPEGGWP